MRQSWHSFPKFTMVCVISRNCKGMTVHRSFLWTQLKRLRKKNKSGLNGIRTYQLYDRAAVLYQVNYLTNLQLVTLWVCNIPVDGDECLSKYERERICFFSSFKTHGNPGNHLFVGVVEKHANVRTTWSLHWRVTEQSTTTSSSFAASDNLGLVNESAL